MPLIVMVGGPCSGKTEYALKLKKYFEEQKKILVNLINEETLNINKAESYKDITNEKTHRSRIKSLVDKDISDKSITIVDTLNYIKGTRYEFYCLVRNNKTRHCVIYIKTPLEKCLENNTKKNEYSIELLKDLYSRMEEPIQSHRWDCPLYTLYPGDDIPFDDICVSLFEGKRPKEPVAAKPDFVFDTNYIFQLDKNCQDVINNILEQQDKDLGNTVINYNDNDSVILNKKFSAIQLKKIKMEFIKISKTVPSKDKKETIKNFVDYILTVQNRF